MARSLTGEFALLHLSVETSFKDVGAFFSGVAGSILLRPRRVIVVIDGCDLEFGLDCVDGDLVAIVGDKRKKLKTGGVFLVEFSVPLIRRAKRRASPIVLEAGIAQGNRVRLQRSPFWRYPLGLYLCHRCDY